MFINIYFLNSTYILVEVGTKQALQKKTKIINWYPLKNINTSNLKFLNKYYEEKHNSKN